MSLASDLFNKKTEAGAGNFTIGKTLDADGDILVAYKDSKGRGHTIYFPSLEDIEQMARICEKLLEEK